MQHLLKKQIGWWVPGNKTSEVSLKKGPDALRQAIHQVNRPVFVILHQGETAVTHDGQGIIDPHIPPSGEGHPLYACVPALHPENLGDAEFKKNHRLRYPYVAGAMANGITSVEMVEAAGRAGMMGFFGAAGLSIERIDAAIRRLQTRLQDLPFGFNLIHSPNEPNHESATVDLYLTRGINRVSASAYLGLTPHVVYYRVKGIHEDGAGGIVCPNKVVAKVSREEVAEKFFSPPPEKILSALVDQGKITRREADLARFVPMAEDLTAEADSGGHTDNRPALSLLPTIISLRDRMAEKYQYRRPPCVGLGGGIATPESAAAAFAMGAAYVLTGSVNQSCVEAGTSETVRRMLAEARQADVIMAPAADMFEMGVRVQVLKRGTMFAIRGGKLYDLYNRYKQYEEIPAEQRSILERDYFRCSFEEAWAQTRDFFSQRDPRQNARAEKDPRHKMALVFRSYLGKASGWAIAGDPARQLDYQIWCGPSMGAFNEWVRGTFLEKPENRQTVVVALNLLAGASVITRANWLRTQGIALPQAAGRFSPLPLSEIETLFE